MSKPLRVTIPHDLGRAEATRRIRGGLGPVLARFGSTLGTYEEHWDGERMDFALRAFGQRIGGHLQVLDDEVRLEVLLPFALVTLAGKARTLLERQGRLLLGKR